MKKIISVVLIFVLTAAVLPMSTLAYTEGDWEYSVAEGKATVTDYFGSDAEVTVPSQLDGCPVTHLKNAFYENNTITKVVVPEGVETIDGFLGAFNSCSNLVEVQLPQSIKTLGDSAFKGSGKLTKVNLPEHLTTIQSYCFAGTAVEEFIIPASVETIGMAAFVNNKNLKTVVFQGVPANMNYDNFRGCTALTAVVLPKSMKTIPQNMFQNCVSLVDITFPEDTVKIDDSAFEGCASLEEIVLPSSVTTIVADAFANCTSLHTVQLSTALKSIDYHAFLGCGSLTNITIPGGVEWMQECDLGIYKDDTGEQRVKGFTITGFEGSVAHQFAQYHSFQFVPLNENGQFGDMDDDSRVNAGDALIALKVAVGKMKATSTQTLAGDVTADGKINAADALLMLQYSVGKVDSLYAK